MASPQPVCVGSRVRQRPRAAGPRHSRRLPRHLRSPAGGLRAPASTLDARDRECWVGPVLRPRSRSPTQHFPSRATIGMRAIPEEKRRDRCRLPLPLSYAPERRHRHVCRPTRVRVPRSSGVLQHNPRTLTCWRKAELASPTSTRRSADAASVTLRSCTLTNG